MESFNEKKIENKYKKFDNSDNTEIKEKLNQLAKQYYINNIKDIIYNDYKFIELPNKRKNSFSVNYYVFKLENLLNKKENNDINNNGVEKKKKYKK